MNFYTLKLKTYIVCINLIIQFYVVKNVLLSVNLLIYKCSYSKILINICFVLGNYLKTSDK